MFYTSPSLVSTRKGPQAHNVESMKQVPQPNTRIPVPSTRQADVSPHKTTLFSLHYSHLIQSHPGATAPVCQSTSNSKFLSLPPVLNFAKCISLHPNQESITSNQLFPLPPSVATHLILYIAPRLCYSSLSEHARSNNCSTASKSRACITCYRLYIHLLSLEWSFEEDDL